MSKNPRLDGLIKDYSKSQKLNRSAIDSYSIPTANADSKPFSKFCRKCILLWLFHIPVNCIVQWDERSVSLGWVLCKVQPGLGVWSRRGFVTTTSEWTLSLEPGIWVLPSVLPAGWLGMYLLRILGNWHSWFKKCILGISVSLYVL